MLLALLLALTCGRELWEMKVLRDPDAAAALRPAPVPSTIVMLIHVPPKGSIRRSYTVEGTVTVIKHEADSDYHVVIEDEAHHTMIVEFPHPGCSKGSLAYGAIVKARKQAATLKLGMRVRVTGMLFMDKIHGQTGVAPNGVELHPVFNVEVP